MGQAQFFPCEAGCVRPFCANVEPTFPNPVRCLTLPLLELESDKYVFLYSGVLLCTVAKGLFNSQLLRYVHTTAQTFGQNLFLQTEMRQQRVQHVQYCASRWHQEMPALPRTGGPTKTTNPREYSRPRPIKVYLLLYVRRHIPPPLQLMMYWYSSTYLVPHILRTWYYLVYLRLSAYSFDGLLSPPACLRRESLPRVVAHQRMGEAIQDAHGSRFRRPRLGVVPSLHHPNFQEEKPRA